MDDTSVKWAINKPFFVFHLIWMKLGDEVVVIHVYYNFTKIHQNGMLKIDL